MKKLKIFIATLIAGLSLLAPLPAMAFNPLEEACLKAPTAPACVQADEQTKKGDANPVTGDNGTLQVATNFIALVAGIGAVIMIFIGAGFYVTAGGNAEAAGKARSRIVSAFIGLVIVMLAWVIVRFVEDRLISLNIY